MNSNLRTSNRDKTLFARLFSPTQLLGLELRNRLVLGPMTRISATEDGLATSAMADAYAAYARGGFGLVMTEAVYVDEAWSQGWVNQPGIANARQKESWVKVCEAIHRGGSPAIMQLYHAGALSQHNRWRSDTIAPSAVQPMGQQAAWFKGSGPYKFPRAITRAEIDDVLESFATAAKSAIEIGFDGVEIHGGNGYLVDQFLTDYSNRRSDSYGGSLANRLRYPLEILEAVRNAVPSEKLVGCSLSVGKANDPQYTWPGGADDARIIFERLGEVRNIFLRAHGTVRTTDRMSDTVFGTGETLPALARRHSHHPVIASGGLEDPALAEDMLARQQCDLVGLSRAGLADPEWPNKVERGTVPIPFDMSALVPDATLASVGAWRARQSA